MKSTWSTHKGTQYFLADYSQFGRDVEGLRAEVDSGDAIIEKQPLDSVLVLVDLRNTVTSSQVVSMMKESATRTKGRVQKTAIIGVGGIQRILAAAVARFSREPLSLFDTIEDARDWLVGVDVKRGVHLDVE